MTSTYYGNCHNTAVRSKSMALLIFWVKTKNKPVFLQITSLIDLGSCDSGRMVASRALHMVIEELSAKFVPLHPCVSHPSRNDALAHMTKIA